MRDDVISKLVGTEVSYLKIQDLSKSSHLVLRKLVYIKQPVKGLYTE
jgi:hypothetical protein